MRRGKEWAKPFGPAPKDSAVANAWWDRIAVIAAYRDRWHVTGRSILGDEADVGSLRQVAHRARARRAGQEAAYLAGLVPQPVVPAVGAPSPDLGTEVDL